MNKKNREIIESYYSENTIVQNQLRSYNFFMETRLKEILLSFSREDIPEYLLDIYDKVNLKIKKVILKKPEYIETDGSKILLTPNISRTRGLSYSAPLFIELETEINGQIDTFEVQIAKMPMMLKSKNCTLYDKSFDELIELREDPYEPGGYFIINGTEKVVVMVEDLALNKLFIEKSNLSIYPIGRTFSQRGVFKSLQEIKKNKTGIYTYSFGNFKEIPLFLILKSLGLEKDKDILTEIESEEVDTIQELSEYSNLKNQEEIFDKISKNFGLLGNINEKAQRINFYLDNFILPHIGITKDKRISKAKLICKYFKKYEQFLKDESKVSIFDDKDHYANKRVKLTGDLFEQMFVSNFKELIFDILTSFQRTIKRGKFSSLKIIVKESFLTQKLNSALALGVWNDGRKGIAQYLKRENYFDMLSHLSRVISPLSSSQENFLARELHPTNFGRLCPIETPEGHSIGLRKNLALMTDITHKKELLDEKTLSKLKDMGLEL